MGHRLTIVAMLKGGLALGVFGFGLGEGVGGHGREIGVMRMYRKRRILGGR
jgi:hypothetical protein